MKHRGFTLIELLVVIAIIALLSSVVLASLNSARGKARNASYMSQMEEYEKALTMYYADHGSYPSTGSWACIGTGYQNSGKLCWNGTYSETTSSSVAFRTALSPYISTSAIPGPAHLTYGSMYEVASAGQKYNIIFILEGDVDCPQGVKYATYGSGTSQVTRCNIYGIGG